MFLLVFQQVYWGFMTHKLMNKLMSGNYGHYVAANEQKKPTKAREIPVKLEDPFENEDLRVLNEMIKPF